MDTETAKEQELFDAALPIANADERNAFLDRACDGDPDLRARVSKLLAAHNHSDRFFQDCLPDFATAAQEIPAISDGDAPQKFSEEMIGTRVGRYKLLKLLARAAVASCIWPSRKSLSAVASRSR